MSSAEGERGAVEFYKKNHTFLSPLMSVRTCQEIRQFIIHRLLFTTCEIKRQKSKLSKIHYFSPLFNFALRPMRAWRRTTPTTLSWASTRGRAVLARLRVTSASVRQKEPLPRGFEAVSTVCAAVKTAAHRSVTRLSMLMTMVSLGFVPNSFSFSEHRISVGNDQDRPEHQLQTSQGSQSPVCAALKTAAHRSVTRLSMLMTMVSLGFVPNSFSFSEHRVSVGNDQDRPEHQLHIPARIL